MKKIVLLTIIIVLSFCIVYAEKPPLKTEALQIGENDVTSFFSTLNESNQVEESGIANGSVTENKIGTGAVTAGKIGTGAVTESKIASSAVTETKIANSAVSTDKLQPTSVTLAKMAKDAVTGNEIVDHSVDSMDVAPRAIIENKIANNAVSTNKIQNQAITLNKMASNAVTGAIIVDHSIDSMDIAPRAVTQNKIADNSISADKLQTASVTNTKLGNNAVSTDKIANAAVTGDKIAESAISGSKIANGSITANKLVDKTITLDELSDEAIWALGGPGAGTYAPDDTTLEFHIVGEDTLIRVKTGSIDSTHIKNGGISADDIKADAITSAKILNGNVTAEKLAAGSVIETKIGTGAVTAGKIAAGAVTNAKIYSQSVTNDKIADNAVSEAKMASNAITADKLANNAVLTSKINNNAVTTEKIQDETILMQDLSLTVRAAMGQMGAGTYPPDDETLEFHVEGEDTLIQIKDQGVNTEQLANGAVTESKLGTGAVTANKIGAGAVTEVKIGSGAVTEAKVGTGAITETKIGAGAVTEGKIASGAVTETKIGTGAVTEEKLSAAVQAKLNSGGGGGSALPGNVLVLDPTCSIQDSINSIRGNSATNWFAIVLTPGEYSVISTIALRPFVTLMGLGLPEDTKLVGSLYNTPFLRADSGNVNIMNLSLVNSYNGSNAFMIHLETTYDTGTNILPCVLDNLYIEYYHNAATTGGGILLSGGASGSSWFNYVDRKSRITNCKIYNRSTSTGNSGNGIKINKTGGSVQNKNEAFEIVNCTVINNTNGISFNESQYEYSYVINCKILNSYWGINGTSSTACTEGDPVIYTSGNHLACGNADFKAVGQSVCLVTIFDTGSYYSAVDMGSYAYLNPSNAYAGLYSNSNITVTLNQNNWKKVTGLTSAGYRGIKVLADSIRTYSAGTFEISLNVSFTGTGADEISCGIFKNNVLQNNLICKRTTATSVVTGGSIESFLTLAKDDVLSFRMMNATDGDDPVIQYSQFCVRSVK